MRYIIRWYAFADFYLRVRICGATLADNVITFKRKEFDQELIAYFEGHDENY